MRPISRWFSFFDRAGRDWQKTWETNLTPWETNSVSRGLEFSKEKILETNIQFSSALIPGCGSAHDAVFLRNLGFGKVVGLDISETAIKVAKRNIDAVLDGEAQQQGISLITANFFEWAPQESFNFVFDYLFFSALDPPMRALWGASMKRLIPIGGTLLTVIFPTFDAETDAEESLSVGPPYRVRMSDYRTVLEPEGFVVVSSERVTNSIKPRAGREVAVIWRREN